MRERKEKTYLSEACDSSEQQQDNRRVTDVLQEEALAQIQT